MSDLEDIPPVDRTCRTLADGTPVTEDHREINPRTGQQKGYVVLCEKERALGYVRPYRDSYIHVGARPSHPLRLLTEEERAQLTDEWYVAYEEYPYEERPESEASRRGRFWTKAQLESGCGTKTTMARPIAETYARDPGFYSGTFCGGCWKHLPLEEFVWDGTNERVGS